MTKKVLTLLLAMVMLVSVCPWAAAESEMTTTLTNVALNKTVTGISTNNSTNVPQLVTDGNLGNFWYGYVKDSTDYPSITVNLGRKYKIEEIIVRDARGTTTINRAKFEIWGSNSPDEGFVKLYEISKDVNSTTSGDAPAYYDTTFPMRGALRITADKTIPYYGDKSGELNGTEVTASGFGDNSGFLVEEPVYQYVRYAATGQRVTHLGELEIYANQTTSENGTIIHPNFYGAEYSAENNEITLNFSENMSETSITKDSVKLYRASGMEVVYDKITVSGNTAVISCGETDLDSGYYYVTAYSTVTNESDANLCKTNISFSVENTEAKTATAKLVNVARGKKAVSYGGLVGGTDTNITDDNYNTRNTGPKDTEQYGAITFDLLRRYPIEKIVIFDNGSDYRGQFEIWGSDTYDNVNKIISGGEKLFELNIAADDAEQNLSEIFPQNGEYTINLTDKPAYRYICYKSKVKGAAYNIKEFEVWATVNATAVSTNCKTHTTPNLESTSTTGDKAVDGLLDGNYFCCKNGGSGYSTGTYLSTFTVDLGSKKNIGMVEIYGRQGVQYSYSDGLFILYGSNDGTVDDYTKSATEGGAAYGTLAEADFEALGYTELYKMSIATSSTTLNDGTTYYPYPKNTSATPLSWSITLNNSTAYRYITHRKTGTGYNGQFSEFIAYELNPDVYGLTKATERGVVVRFSDWNMNESSLESNILLLDADGTIISGGIKSVSVINDADGNPTADVKVTFKDGLLTKGETYKIHIGKGAKNTYGTALAEEVTCEFVVPEDVVVSEYNNPEFKASEENTFSFTLTNNTASEKTVMAVIALYSGNKLETLDVQEVTVDKDGASKPFSVKATDSDATKMKVFIWDAKTIAPVKYHLEND